MKKIFSLFAAVLFAGSMMAAPAVLFHETFGDNSSSARAWDDSYSEKSGVATVYAGIAAYDVTNAKQSKNTMGSELSALTQTTKDVDAVLVVGPLNVSAYNSLKVTYQWKAASIKATYSTDLYYATSASGEYTKVEGTGAGATTYVEREYSLPEAAQVATLYLKVVWNTSNTSGLIDELELTGEGGEKIDATNIELDKTELNLVEGESETLVATLTPSDATTTVVWESSDEAVATVSSKGKVTAVAPGTAVIKATAGSVFANCDVTVTAAPLMTCAEAAALAKDEIAKMGEVIVSCVAGSNIYIKDATGYALIYKKDFGLLAGDVVNGFIGKSSPYNGLPELIPTVTLSDLDVVHGDAPAPEELTAAPTTADINRYVIIKGVKFATATFDNKNITAILNEEEFVVRNNFNLDIAFDTNKRYDIVGAGAIYNTTLQLYLINATESSTTAIDNTNAEVKVIKRIENGQLVIIKNGVRYNALGAQF